MRQAIEEGFILDVLKNFISYRTYWTLLKKVKEDPKYDRQKASKLLTRFVAENPKTIREKVEVDRRTPRHQGARPDRPPRTGDASDQFAATGGVVQAGRGQVPRGEGLHVEGRGRVLRHGHRRGDEEGDTPKPA